LKELEVEEIFLENDTLNLVINDEEAVDEINRLEQYDIKLSAVQYPEFSKIFEISLIDKDYNREYKISIEFDEEYLPMFKKYFEFVRILAFTDLDYKNPEKFFLLEEDDKLPWIEHFKAWDEILTLEKMLKWEGMEL
jgi:hypothetical protein